MPVILTKKSDTPGSIPSTANLTNLAGGAELAVNTADKRLFSMNSSSAIIEVGTNPSSLTCADASFTVARVGSLTISSLSLTNATFTSATITTLTSTSAGITTLTSSSATISTTLALSGGTANGVLYLNGSKVATSGSALTFDGSGLGINMVASEGGVTPALFAKQNSNGAFEGLVVRSSAAGGEILAISYDGSVFNHTASYVGSGGYVPLAWTVSGSEAMRLTSTGLGIGTSSPSQKLHVLADTSGALFQGTTLGGITFLKTGQVGMQLFSDATGTLKFYDNNAGATQLTLASGNLGLGVTPSAWKSTNPAFQIGQSGSVFSYSSTNIVGLGANFFINSAGDEKYITTNTAGFYRIFGNVHTWWNAPSGTAGNTITFTQAMTLDASGNLQLGGTTNKTTGVSGSGSGFTVQASGAPTVSIWDTTDTSYYTNFTQINEVSYLWNIANGAMIFATNNTERARITAGGYFKASNDGTYQGSTANYHEFRSTNNDATARILNTNASFADYVLYLQADRARSDNYYFLRCVSGTANELLIQGDGDVTNTNGTYAAFSDIKLKQDVVDASSQWDDIKNLRVRKYRLKSDPNGPLQIGVIAQELEEVSPGLVSEKVDHDIEGNDLGTTTKSVKYSILYMKSIKALQEAMARIEKLEAEVAALKGA